MKKLLILVVFLNNLHFLFANDVSESKFRLIYLPSSYQLDKSDVIKQNKPQQERKLTFFKGLEQGFGIAVSTQFIELVLLILGLVAYDKLYNLSEDEKDLIFVTAIKRYKLLTLGSVTLSSLVTLFMIKSNKIIEGGFLKSEKNQLNYKGNLGVVSGAILSHLFMFFMGFTYNDFMSGMKVGKYHC